MKKLYIDDELHRQFKASSAENGIPIQDLTKKVIKEYLKNRKVKK